jgi:hypothetical protein
MERNYQGTKAHQVFRQNAAEERCSTPKNEPLSRGNGGKPHWAEQCYRSGGDTVYVSAKYPTGLTAEEYKNLPASERNLGFNIMKRDAAVYVRGKVSHPDHETVALNGWHRVLMNTENRSSAMRFLAFLD